MTSTSRVTKTRHASSDSTAGEPRRIRLWLTRIGLFAAVAVAAYVLVIILVLTAVATTGDGGLSCRGDGCGPVADFLDGAAPWPAIGGTVLSLMIAAMIVRKRAR